MGVSQHAMPASRAQSSKGIFRTQAAPQFWRVNSCQKCAAYTRANTIYLVGLNNVSTSGIIIIIIRSCRGSQFNYFAVMGH
jgi:hypothetical protein